MPNQELDTEKGPEEFSEVSPLTVQQPRHLPKSSDNPNVQVQFEQKDVSIGKARYRGRIPISNNLAMQRTNRCRTRIIPHANVKVVLLGKNGRPVKMTERHVKSWTITPVQPAFLLASLSSSTQMSPRRAARTLPPSASSHSATFACSNAAISAKCALTSAKNGGWHRDVLIAASGRLCARRRWRSTGKCTDLTCRQNPGTSSV
jgi:hypothetical protein